MATSDKMYKNALKQFKSSLRLTVHCKDGARDVFFYDRGIKAVDDPFNLLSKTNYLGEPRFLEDCITVYGKHNVTVSELGKYEEHADLIRLL